MAVKFVPAKIVPLLHADLLRRYGGSSGIRERSLLESALAQPQATSGGQYLHKTIFEKAAAYGFHVAKNHPFLDGNKRVAFALMDIFLQVNGWNLSADEREAYLIMMNLVQGRCSKAQLAVWLKRNSKKANR